MTSPLWTLSATTLARMIRERKVTSTEVVGAHIDRIERVNPGLNAVVKDRFAEARDEARAADRRAASSASSDLPELHGVPCTIKESFALTGMPQTSGLVSRRGYLASADATTVARLRAAGAIPLGVTNVSELCMWMESDNRVYGRTRNAYDPARTAGGSSGGEGAIVGAGGAPFGLGADIGGSIRMPAFFNGVFGHKPTGGMVPGTGQHPIASNEALRYLSTGPIARRAEDLMPLLRILAGPDDQDLRCAAFPLGDPAAVSMEDLTVLDVRDRNHIPISRDLLSAQDRAVAALEKRGARVRKTSVPGLRHAVEIWSAMTQAAGGPTFAELLGNDGPAVNPLLEFARFCAGRSPHTLPAIGLALLEQIPKLLGSSSAAFIESGRKLRAELAELLGPRHRDALSPLPDARAAPWLRAPAADAVGIYSDLQRAGAARHGRPGGAQSRRGPAGRAGGGGFRERSRHHRCRARPRGRARRLDAASALSVIFAELAAPGDGRWAMG